MAELTLELHHVIDLVLAFGQVLHAATESISLLITEAW